MRAVCSGASGKKPAACADIPESPKVNVTILSDNRCGPDCDPKRAEGGLRSKVANPIVTTVDYLSADGKRLFAQIKPTSLPAAIFDSTLDADKDAIAALRGIRETGSYKVLGMGGWNPACADDGGCKLDECKNTMQCRVEAPEEARRVRHVAVPVRREGARRDEGGRRQLQEGGRSDRLRRPLHRRRGHIGADLDAGRRRGGGGPPRGVRHQALRQGASNTWITSGAGTRTSATPTGSRAPGGSTGIDTDAIKACSEGAEGKQLVAKSFAESKAAGIGASPTWLANNKYKFSGIDAQTIKTNLCAHNPDLKGCDATLRARRPPSRARRIRAAGGERGRAIRVRRPASSGCARGSGSAAAERLNDVHLVVRSEVLPDVEHLLSVHEETDVRAHPVLLVDHAEADSRVAPSRIASTSSSVPPLASTCGSPVYERSGSGSGPSSCVHPLTRRTGPSPNCRGLPTA